MKKFNDGFHVVKGKGKQQRGATLYRIDEIYIGPRSDQFANGLHLSSGSGGMKGRLALLLINGVRIKTLLQQLAKSGYVSATGRTM